MVDAGCMLLLLVSAMFALFMHYYTHKSVCATPKSPVKWLTMKTYNQYKCVHISVWSLVKNYFKYPHNAIHTDNNWEEKWKNTVNIWQKRLTIEPLATINQQNVKCEIIKSAVSLCICAVVWAQNH